MVRKIFAVVVFCGYLFVAPSASAGNVFYETTVYRVVQDASGACYVRVSPGPLSQGLGACNDRFVSLDCAGAFDGTKSNNISMFQLLQASLFVNTPAVASIDVTDDHITVINGEQYCVVESVQVAN